MDGIDGQFGIVLPPPRLRERRRALAGTHHAHPRLRVGTHRARAGIGASASRISHAGPFSLAFSLHFRASGE
jgi:hypothetical protein